MNLRYRTFLHFLVITLLFAFVGHTGADQRKAKKLTALDRYVAKADSNYGYKLVNTDATQFVVDGGGARPGPR